MKRVREIKHTCPVVTRPAMRLGEVERLISKYRIVMPTPSRPKLQRLCEEGIFETVGGAPTEFGWLVYEDSFWKWASKMAGEGQKHDR